MKILFYDTKSYDKESFEKRREEYPEIEIHYLKSELNEETADWWIETSQGDTVSLISALEKHKDDTNEVYGGQKLYSFWLEQAKGIDYSLVTKYDTEIGNAWGNAISKIKTGELDKDAAIAEFYDTVESTFAGEIEVVR